MTSTAATAPVPKERKYDLVGFLCHGSFGGLGRALGAPAPPRAAADRAGAERSQQPQRR